MIVHRLVAPHSIDKAVSYQIMSPDGQQYNVMGLQAFAVLFDLKPSSLKNAARGTGRLNGWKIAVIPESDITEVATFWDHPELAERMKAAKAAGKFRR